MNGIYIFKLFGIPVYFSIWYFLLLLYFGFQSTSYQEGILWGLAVTMSLLFHEFGHGLTAKFLGLKPTILLHGFGGLCAHQKPLKKKHEAWIIVFGPLGGFFLAFLSLVVLWAGLQYFPQQFQQPYVHYLLTVLIQINIFWSLLNLIPLWPLDGGQLYSLLIFYLWRKRPLRAHQIVHGTGMALSIGIFLFGYWQQQIFMMILSAIGAWMNFQKWSEGSSLRARVNQKAAMIWTLFKDAEKAMDSEDWAEAERLGHYMRSIFGANGEAELLNKIWKIIIIASFHQNKYEEVLKYLKNAELDLDLKLMKYLSHKMLGQDELAFQFLKEHPEIESRLKEILKNFQYDFKIS